jgi:hypothetical protein
MHVQLGVAALALGLLAFLPANARIMALETSHRQFSLHMQDVARAYTAVHAADREGTFGLRHEFDATKERIAWLRDHPDLGMLEPDVLEVAAQMGVISRELAEIYSTEKVARARSFLTQRQEEIARFEERIDAAKAIANEIRHWAARVSLEEDVARSEMARLREMLQEALPEMFDAAPPTAEAARPDAALPDVSAAVRRTLRGEDARPYAAEAPAAGAPCDADTPERQTRRMARAMTPRGTAGWSAGAADGAAGPERFGPFESPFESPCENAGEDRRARATVTRLPLRDAAE